MFQGYSTDQTLLTYNQTKLFFWDNSTSGEGLEETDTICTINIPLLVSVSISTPSYLCPILLHFSLLQTAIDQVEEFAKEHSTLGLPAKLYLEHIISVTGAKLHVCVGARDLAWNYTDKLVERLHTDMVLKLVGLAYPRCCVNLQLNASSNDSIPSVIFTGVKDINRIGQFYQWDGLRELTIWPGRTANDINGTEGLFFKPNLNEGEPLMAFVDDVIRSFDLVQTDKVKHLGLEAWRYMLNSNTFRSPLNYPPNARWGSWEYDGLMYLGVIQYPNVPVYGSKPHFMDGDPILREKVIGMHPDPALHSTQIDVEIYTGANIQFRRQLQLNVRAVKNTDFS